MSVLYRTVKNQNFSECSTLRCLAASTASVWRLLLRTMYMFRYNVCVSCRLSVCCSAAKVVSVNRRRLNLPLSDDGSMRCRRTEIVLIMCTMHSVTYVIDWPRNIAGSFSKRITTDFFYNVWHCLWMFWWRHGCPTLNVNVGCTLCLTTFSQLFATAHCTQSPP